MTRLAAVAAIITALLLGPFGCDVFRPAADPAKRAHNCASLADAQLQVDAIFADGAAGEGGAGATDVADVADVADAARYQAAYTAHLAALQALHGCK